METSSKRKSLSLSSFFGVGSSSSSSSSSPHKSSPALPKPTALDNNAAPADGVVAEAVQIYPRPDPLSSSTCTTRRRHHSVSSPIVLAQHEPSSSSSPSLRLSAYSNRSSVSGSSGGTGDLLITPPRRIQLVPKTMRGDGSARSLRAGSLPNLPSAISEAECSIDSLAPTATTTTPADIDNDNNNDSAPAGSGPMPIAVAVFSGGGGRKSSKQPDNNNTPLSVVNEEEGEV